ncbi:MAG: DUF3341 domain-containing protein [Chloroflexaceae bacterium]|nr:DUF3341 domain-containing protein [Chloroflexaceae bacterium]NJL34379.1 DUF3341 domain-containing protein [Chloroflexaceae bacterium]NJO04497.1 DUF3341 domain-containing protein [Chloroflexaceae bacterium]
MSVPMYGLMAEFQSPEQLVHATEAAYKAGYRRMDAYSPFPIEEVSEAMHFHDDLLRRIVLVAAISGLITALVLQVLGSAIDYPLNIGGRPLLDWPAFIPITFELTILFSGFAAVISVVVLNGLPQPYHPVFNAPNFDRASIDRFFLCIEANDPKFERTATRTFLEGLHPMNVSEVDQ